MSNRQMHSVFSPRQVAQAIGASESSVKRWCDQGVLPSTKTAGGHRRVPMSGILEFVRQHNRDLVNPIELGLPPSVGRRRNQLDVAGVDFTAALVAGDYAACRTIIYDLFLSEHPMSSILDRVVSGAMHEMGEAWCDERVEIFEERRGCEIVSRLLHDLRSALPSPKESAPLAIGGSADPYLLPGKMVELVLLEAGWNVSLLGGGLPLSSMAVATDKHRPRLFWLSVSAVESERLFLEEYTALKQSCGSETALVVGGRGLTAELRGQMQYSAYCDNLQHLATFVETIQPKE